MTIRALIIAASFLASGVAQAHEPRKGPNGGTLVDAGAHHVELVTAGRAVKVFVSDAADAPLAPDGYKGTAVLLVGGKPARITLAPAGAFLSGTLAGPSEGPVKGAVQLTGPDGKTSQAKFN